MGDYIVEIIVGICVGIFLLDIILNQRHKDKKFEENLKKKKEYYANQEHSKIIINEREENFNKTKNSTLPLFHKKMEKVLDSYKLIENSTKSDIEIIKTTTLKTKNLIYESLNKKWVTKSETETNFAAWSESERATEPWKMIEQYYKKKTNELKSQYILDFNDGGVQKLKLLIEEYAYIKKELITLNNRRDFILEKKLKSGRNKFISLANNFGNKYSQELTNVESYLKAAKQALKEVSSNKKKTTIKSSGNKAPDWFDGTLYEKGDTIEYKGKEFKLSALELSIYDLLMGSYAMTESPASQFNPNYASFMINQKNCIEWFRVESPELFEALTAID